MPPPITLDHDLGRIRGIFSGSSAWFHIQPGRRGRCRPPYKHNIRVSRETKSFPSLELWKRSCYNDRVYKEV